MQLYISTFKVNDFITKVRKVIVLETVHYRYDHRGGNGYINLASEQAQKMPLYLNSMANWIEGGKYYSKKDNSWNYYLLYTIAGKGLIEYRKQKKILSEGDICFIDCKEPHYYQSFDNNEWHSVWFHVNGSSAKDFHDIINPDDSFNVIQLKDNNLILEVYDDILQHINKTNIEDECHIFLTLNRLFCEIINKKYACAKISDPPVWLLDILSYIEHRLKSDITISQIANHFNISQYELDCALLTYYKKSTSEIIMSQRLKKEQTDENYKACQNPKWLMDAVIYIEDNFNRKIVLKDLITNAHVSKPLFIEQFKKFTCMSPTEYITNLRLRKALLYLDNTDYSITDIAFMTGFNSHSFFSEKFKEFIGISPKEYRLKR